MGDDKLSTKRSSWPKESFVRWQGTTIAQLGYAVNLILSLATASLGFCFVLVKDEDYATGCWGKVLFALSLLLLIVSVISGVACVINRLVDFRKTARIARDREEWTREGLEEQEIDGRLLLTLVDS